LHVRASIILNGYFPRYKALFLFDFICSRQFSTSRLAKISFTFYTLYIRGVDHNFFKWYRPLRQCMYVYIT